MQEPGQVCPSDDPCRPLWRRLTHDAQRRAWRRVMGRALPTMSWRGACGGEAEESRKSAARILQKPNKLCSELSYGICSTEFPAASPPPPPALPSRPANPTKTRDKCSTPGSANEHIAVWPSWQPPPPPRLQHGGHRAGPRPKDKCSEVQRSAVHVPFIKAGVPASADPFAVLHVGQGCL